MKYTLLTGATGLLGAYLLYDLLCDGVRCAVLVRSSRLESARQRIEALMARFEKNTGKVCPRPVILEGDLSENLGLDETRTRWMREHCDRVLHNAASLSFEHEKDTDEPYRSNVAGLRHVLDFCKKTGIQNFHHVSTAYVCGLRKGVCLETELDVGQEYGNAYEISKVQGEKMVLEAGFRVPPTFYRPAIITGDSRDGYTSTYHGFYTPLKVVAALVTSVAETSDSLNLVRGLGLDGEEHKNFVPVEWVSQAIVRLMRNPANLGKTFHLTPRNRVKIQEMYEAFTLAFFMYVQKHQAELEKKTKRTVRGINWTSMLNSFREQMKVYQSYWRDDPIFDSINTQRALPDLPCPEMNAEVLLRLSLFALEANFGWPKPRPFQPAMNVEENLSVKPGFQSFLNPAEKRFGLQVNGEGGGQWTVHYSGEMADARVSAITESLPAEDFPLLYMNSRTFAAMKEHRLSPEDAIQAGAVVWCSPDSAETAVPHAAEVAAVVRRLFSF